MVSFKLIAREMNKIPRHKFTPEELVETEIERLKQTEAVKLAQKEQRILMRRRKYLADLRWLEKRGKKLMDEGWSYDTIDLMYKPIPEVD